MKTCNSCDSNKNIIKGCKNNGVCTTGSCKTKLSVFDWLANIHPVHIKGESQYVEVRFKNDRKDFYIEDPSILVTVGDVVIVEANSGHDIGKVSLTGELVKIQMRKKKPKSPQLLKIRRKANQKDIDTWDNLREKESNIILEARRIARGLGLQMKVCDAEYQGDGTKITLYYTSEGRVDFRQLIKDYALNFRSKIDMRQIGYRQESAKVGGIGSCGRELCCSTWLTDFHSVNTIVARYQQLSINPQKLAGQCGKLKCCLNFELDTYVDALADFPSNQTILETEQGKAYCIKVDVFRRQMWFTYQNSITWYPIDIDTVKKMAELNKQGVILEPLSNNNQKKEELSKDLVEENNLNRFENKARSNNKKRSRQKPQSNTNPQQKKKNPKNSK